MKIEKIENKIFCSHENCFENDHFNEVLKNGEISHVAYDGLSIEQNPNVIYPLWELINKIKPARVIEIGTFAGGLTLIIRDVLDYSELSNSDLITYDVNNPNFLMEKIGDKKIKVLVKNLFSEDYSKFKSNEEKEELSDYIIGDGCSLILCDGGSKKNEFNLISPLLKVGDVIMAHDYCYDNEIFQNEIFGKYWNWMEIENSDIKQVSHDNFLEDFMGSEFKNVAWVCKMKIK